MDVYRQAAEIIKIVRAGNGTAKALCLRKEMQKKRQTYAVVCETLRHYELLEDVLAVAEFFKYYPSANKDFALCMAYDVVLGKGISTKTDTTARAVQDASSYLREAYWRVCKHHVIPPRTDERFEEEQTARGENTDGGECAVGTPAVLRLPRYARVNTLKIDKDVLISRLRNAAEHHRQEALRRSAAGGSSGVKRGRDESGGAHAIDDASSSKRGTSTRPKAAMPDFTEDPVVPSLLVFPHGTDLHAHPAVRRGQLVLQDRASCLPASILLDAVPVVRAFPVSVSDMASKPLEYVIDACAAPGNKTTQVAALGVPRVKLMAIERDERRAELLQRRVRSLGAADYVNVVNMDFFHLSSDDRAATEAILLDPSCSASGVVTRVDVALMHQKNTIRQARVDNAANKNGGGGGGDHGVMVEHDEEGGEMDAEGTATTSMNPAEQGNDFAAKESRVEKLAGLQRKLLAHSLLSFDNCRTVVYSTCSVHEVENEDVVRAVLSDTRVQARGWKLSNIMPNGVWKTRGITREGDVGPLDFTIRCDPAKDATNGFYVARFDRPMEIVASAPVSKAKEAKTVHAEGGNGEMRKVVELAKATELEYSSDDVDEETVPKPKRASQRPTGPITFDDSDDSD